MKNLIIALWIILIIYLAYLLYNYYSYKKLIKQLKTIPFPKEYENILEKIPQYKNLPKDLQTKIKYSILLFIKTKKFIGIKLNITDEMKVIIAFFACLIVINKEECYENLEYIYIYPHKMVIDTINNNGINKDMFIIEGQALNNSVIIAWDEAKKEAYHLREHNVIIHEFTHELDFESGVIDGVPKLEKSNYYEWLKILGRSYEEFRNKIVNHKSLGKYKLIDKYASTNKAEFFAVLSEMFWTKPKILKLHFPKIYKEFVKFFNFKPL
jgi:Mlc titration factor MtfA (ptsG expression regulator)